MTNNDTQIRVSNLVGQVFNLAPTATKVPRTKVSDGDWVPALKKCHENVDTWCSRNKDFEPVRGWLLMDLRAASQFFGHPPKIDLLAHSVVKGPKGLEDITPAFDHGVGGGPDIYPFIPHPGSTEDFEVFINQWQISRISYFPETKTLVVSSN